MYPKVILHKQKTFSTGLSPVCIQVIVDRKAIRKNLFTLKEAHWDAKNSRVKSVNPNYLEYNDLISMKLAEVERRCIDAARKNIIPDSKFLFDSVVGDKVVDILKKYTELLKKDQKFTAAEKNNNLINEVLSFHKDVITTGIDEKFFDRFKQFLQRKNSVNTVSKKLSMFRTALRKCDVELTAKVNNYKLEHKASVKDKLNKEEFEALRNLDLTHLPILELHRDAFLLAFFLRGRRVGDLLSLQHSEMKKGRVQRDANKTDKFMDIHIVPQAQEILNKYKDKHPLYCLPIMKMLPSNDKFAYQKQIESKTTILNRSLKILAGMCGIEKNLTTHVSRHTFAYLADLSGKVPPKRLMDMLEHSDLETTMIYANSLQKNDELDKAMDDFLGWLED